MVIDVHHVIYLWHFNPLIKSLQHENCDVIFCLHREHMRSASVIWKRLWRHSRAFPACTDRCWPTMLHNDVFRFMFYLPRYIKVSNIFVLPNIQSFPVLRRSLAYSIMCKRVPASSNSLVKALVDSSFFSRRLGYL